jgi:signal transduction histidine kinase
LRPRADDASIERGYRPAVSSIEAGRRRALTALRGIASRDARIAAIAAAIQIGGSVGASHRHGTHGCWWASSCKAPAHLDAGAFVLLALGPVALLLRRRYPRAVLAFVFLVTLLYVILGYQPGPNYASLAIAYIGAVASGERRAAVAVLIAGWAMFLWLPAALGNTGAPTALAALAVAAWLLVAFAGGEALRERRERAAQAREARRREARRKADEERIRIARELHDVLAHNISLINVQSGVALHLLDEQPEQARSALTAINEASADALREVRSVLGVLRGKREQAPLAPTVGLDQLDELVSRAAAAGVEVALRVSGDRRPLPASVDLAAFRIVQESLTNVVRHAGAGAATVELTYGSGELRVQIDDDGAGSGLLSDDGAGSGIAGMRERAAALGGEFEAGPLLGGGFRVRARLPIGGHR